MIRGGDGGLIPAATPRNRPAATPNATSEAIGEGLGRRRRSLGGSGRRKAGGGHPGRYSDELLVVHLVHGTWPLWHAASAKASCRSRPPLWFEEGSAFREEVAGQLHGEAKFVRFDWSGRNSAQARFTAAKCLAERIAQTAVSEPDSHQVVIAHSHGGNVATHVASLLPSSSRLIGVATLATPFLHVRERELQRARRDHGNARYIHDFYFELWVPSYAAYAAG